MNNNHVPKVTCINTHHYHNEQRKCAMSWKIIITIIVTSWNGAKSSQHKFIPKNIQRIVIIPQFLTVGNEDNQQLNVQARRYTFSMEVAVS